MSTFPPPMPSSAAPPPPMGYPPTPPPYNPPASMPYTGTVPIANMSAPTDYGPIGKAPVGAGIGYFSEKAGNKLGALLPIAMGLVFLFAGALATAVLAQASVGDALFGLIFVLIGCGLIALGWYFIKKTAHRDVICDSHGITVRHAAKGKIAQPPTFLPWSKITGTRYESYLRQTSSDDGTSSSYMCYRFVIAEQAGPGISIDQRDVKALPALVGFVNTHTPQLSYQWVRGGRGLQVQLQVGDYARVAR